jgi:hypothetical protein
MKLSHDGENHDFEPNYFLNPIFFFTPYGHKVDCTIKKEGVYDNVYTNLR